VATPLPPLDSLGYTLRSGEDDMYHSEHEFAAEVVADACRLGQRVQADVAAGGRSVAKDDRSPVTIADLAIQAVIAHRLAARFPSDALLAEEESEIIIREPSLGDSVLELARHSVSDLSIDGVLTALDHGRHASSERRWVLDPVDGTKGFLRGEQYAVALAMVVNGQVEVGLLGCPNLPNDGGGIGCIFSARRGAGATVRSLDDTAESPVTVDDVIEPAEAVFCESVEAAHAAHSDQAEIAARLGISRPSVRIDSQCKYAIVARGDASIYLRLPSKRDYREKVWDHAAGSIIIEEAGGRVSDLGGAPLDFSEGRHLGRHHGIVATNGRIHDQVLRACRDVLGLDGS
jgi:3'(2'), 5'-bisphosphate nucleotidase